MLAGDALFAEQKRVGRLGVWISQNRIVVAELWDKPISGRDMWEEFYRKVRLSVDHDYILSGRFQRLSSSDPLSLFWGIRWEVKIDAIQEPD
jgi:hypothetical protein